MSFEEIVKVIPENFNKIVLQFCPDNLNIQNYAAIPAEPECSIMVSNEFKSKRDFFRFPEPYRC